MLAVKNIKKSFGNVNVLKGIDFNIDKGDRLAIIGSSGCGKSTLLRCLNLISKPDSGEIILDGVCLTDNGINLPEIRKKIGMVFQHFNLFENLNVLDNIILAPVKLGIMDKDSAIKEAKRYLKLINLSNKCNSYPSSLSGGEKQRVAIVRTLIMNPEIILFDEPTSALDPEMVGEVLDLINKIANDGMTMIIVSHELKFVKEIANKVLFLDRGNVSFFGTVEDAFSNNGNERLTEFINSVN